MRPLYLVVCGTHGTGKTTLIEALKPKLERKLRQSVSIISGIPELVAEKHPINEKSTEITQYAIEAEFLRVENRYRTRHKLADRCIIDRYAYGRANKLNLDGYYEKMLTETLALYSLIFYVPIDDQLVPLVDNGVRSTDPAYRKRVQESVEWIIKKYHVPVHIVEGSLDHRVELALRTINLYY